MSKQLTMEESFMAAIMAELNNPTSRLVFADWLEEQGDMERARLYRGVVKRFGTDFDSPGGALTLDSGEVSDTNGENGYHTRTHEDGWTISGLIHEDYYVWVNSFVATHPTLGRVEGDFESVVFATSEEAFQDFYSKHTPHAWDYYDI